MTIQRTDAKPAEDIGEISLRGSPERRVRAELTKQADTVATGIGNNAQTVADVISYRPPPGQAITRPPESSTSISDQYGTPSVGDVAATAVAAGLVLGAAGHKISETIKGWNERRAGDE